MRIITLTSDMGLKDFYVSAIKGYILKRVPQAQIIDITHEIRPFNIIETAFCVSNIISDFPDDTIHIIAVNDDPMININLPSNNDEWPIVVRYMNQYFVGIDNGVFALILKQNEPEAIFRITEMMTKPGIHLFPAKNILANIACQIASGIDLNDIGEKVNHVKKATDFVPIIEPNRILGHVAYVDHYGNLISNITKDIFESVGQNEPYIIYFKSRKYFIDIIHESYSSVENGERVAIFNANGHLEIAINMGASNNGGGANSLFGMKERDLIKVEFTPRGSKETIDSLF